ncbi:MAG: hypothetical protein ACSW8G_02705 [Bacillota bacterium]
MKGVSKYAGLLLLSIVLSAFVLTGCGSDVNEETTEDITEEATTAQSSGFERLSSAEDIGLYDVDGAGTNYAFMYHDEEFSATYLPDNWTIYDSYKITDRRDMIIICEALTDVHAIHGSDMVSYRTPEDMAYEWKQHNLACNFLSEDSQWRQSAENVDFDPADQGKSLKEMFDDRTGN